MGLDDIIFLPLELPDLKLENFSDNFEKYSRVMPDTTTYSYSNGIEGKTTTNLNYWSQWVVFNNKIWNEYFVNLYPNFVTIVETLPYEKLIRIYFFKQIKELTPHKDFVTGLDTGYPSAIRYWVINEELDRTFYFIHNDKKIFPKYPEDTKWWIMNSTFVQHGSHMPENSKEKIIMGVYGIPDEKSMKTLIKKSENKYNEYMVMKEKFECVL